MEKQPFTFFRHVFNITISGVDYGHITKEFLFIMADYYLKGKGYHLHSEISHYHYDVYKNNVKVSVVDKEAIIVDTYVIDTEREYSLVTLIIVFSINAVNCRRD